MTTPRPILALCSLLLAGTAAGCDAEDPAAGRVDYRAMGHVDLGALTSAPWMKGAMKDGKLEIDGKLGPCAPLVQEASALTFGAKDEAFEVYVQGSFDAAEANACAEFIDAEVAAKASPAKGKDEPKPEATLLAEGVFVIFGGDLTPSRARLEALLDADPSGGQPMWVTADLSGSSKQVEHVEAWADPSRGMKAHAQVVFSDAAKASEVYGQAVLGRTALLTSDEMGDLASAIDLDNQGKALSAELTLSTTQMKSIVAKSKARAEHRRDAKGSGVQLHIEAK